MDEVSLSSVKARDWVFVQWFEQKLFFALWTSFKVQPLCGEVVPVTPDWFSRVAGEVERGPGTPRCAQSGAGAGAEWPWAEQLEQALPRSPAPALGEAWLWRELG